MFTMFFVQHLKAFLESPVSKVRQHPHRGGGFLKLLSNPQRWLVTFATRSPCRSSRLTSNMRTPLTGTWAVRSHQLACQGSASARGQLTAWALLTMLSCVPPSCCVVTSIWSSLARQISMPVRSFQQALLCKFNYSSVPHYCWLTAPWTNLTLTVGFFTYQN